MAELQYKTFSSLMDTVEEDLSRFADNNLIKRRRYIKTVRTVNSDLGLMINKRKEIFIDVENYRADLPTDLLSIICMMSVEQRHGGYLGTSMIPGTHIVYNTREDLISKNIPITTEGCISTCNNCYWVTRKTQSAEIIYSYMQLLKPSVDAKKYFCKDSINRSISDGRYIVDIHDEEIHVNFESGTIYINYLCDMIDEDGNLLLLDHPLVNDYYEWAVKSKVLEDIWHNSDADVERKYVNARDIQLPKYRARAEKIVTFPGYRKMKEYNQKLLGNYYDKYVKMFY